MQRKVSPGWLLAALAFVALCALTCTAPPAPPPSTARTMTAEEAVDLAREIRGPLRAATLAGELPPHAHPAPLEFLGRCELLPGQTRAGEPAEGNLHPRGYGTDAFVWPAARGGWRMLLNHPVPAGSKWPTAIFGAASPDGRRWTAPEPVLLPEPGGVERPQQWETPARLELADGSELLAVLTYRYDARGNRTDSLAFFRRARGRLEPWGTPIEPTLPEEQPYRDGKGKLYGGCHEPSLFRFGPWIACVYLGASYAEGQRPTLLLAATNDEGRSWLKLDRPLFTDPESDTGVGSPMVYEDPRGGFGLVWQHRRGLRFEVRQAWSANLVTWFVNPRPLVTQSEAWPGRITAPHAVVVDGDVRVWAFGCPRLDGGEPATRAPFWFGVWGRR